MKKLILLILMGVVFAGHASNPLLVQAEKAYDSKNYKEAINCYEKLVDGGYKSEQLYFNLGNAYYRNSELGKAIYYYELARKADPNDEDVNINLGIASAKTIDKIDSKENFFITAVKSGLLTSLSTTAWAWVTIVMLFTACACFFIYMNSGSVLVKRITFLFSSLLLLGFICTYLLGYSAMKARFQNKFAIILIQEVRIMNEPTAVAKSKFSLHEGTKVRVVESNGDWVLIKLDNGNEGWVKLGEVGVI